MADIIRLKIDVTKIDKARLFKGQKGVYLDATLLRRSDNYGNDWMIVQDVTKEERQAGTKGNILGNGRDILDMRKGTKPEPQQAKPEAKDDAFAGFVGEDDIPF